MYTQSFVSYNYVAIKSDEPKHTLDEAQFRYMHNDDPMAVEKLSEGIRKFAVDTIKLEDFIKGKMNSK